MRKLNKFIPYLIKNGAVMQPELYFATSAVLEHWYENYEFMALEDVDRLLVMLLAKDASHMDIFWLEKPKIKGLDGAIIDELIEIALEKGQAFYDSIRYHNMEFALASP